MSCTDNKSFAIPEAVFERYADTVYRLAFVRTGNRSDSDDILQEVFLRYMKVWGKMESEEHIKATLIRITVNCSNSWLTSSWFKKTAPLDENISVTDENTAENALYEVLKLPVKYRTVIHLHYYMGYSVAEIGEITKTNPSTVKTRLSRARGQLKKVLEAEDL
ncbi:MAG: sigma-70 family RNA polymerase sigma factor [Acutalibacteraceae bacterium]|nr:sigma-70 family RNA polymerase sigma factor [Acutalibacteraceae bacterium]